MHQFPKTGDKHEFRFVVEDRHTVQFPGLPAVFSTPALIWQLETAAMRLIEPFLPEGTLTLGTHVDVQHLGPALLGDEVVCRATMVQGDRKEFTFRVEAVCRDRKIGQGLHRRRLVTIEQMRKRLGIAR